MVEIPIEAQVLCKDGAAGLTSHVIIDPTSRKVTHFVVMTDEVVGSQNWLVPLDMVSETSHDFVKLDCTLEELQQLPAFSEMHWLEADREDTGYAADAVYLAPYVTPMRTDGIVVEVESLPPGELAVRRGAFVEATDGLVGSVGEFLIDADSGVVTHIVLQEGHLWGKREIVVPLSAVEETLESTVYLKLTRAEVESLPGIPIRRHHSKEGESRDVALVTKLFGAQDEASAALKQIKKRKEIKIRDAVVIVKDAKGKVKVKETADVSASRGGIAGGVAGGLIGLAGGPVGVVVGALVGAGAGGLAASKIDTGFSNEFLEKFEESVQPDSSALIVLVEEKSGTDLAEVLSEFEGIMLRQALSDQMVQQMIGTGPEQESAAKNRPASEEQLGAEEEPAAEGEGVETETDEAGESGG